MCTDKKGKVRQGKARQGKAKQGKTREGFTSHNNHAQEDRDHSLQMQMLLLIQ